MKNIVLELTVLLSTFGYGLTFTMSRPTFSSSMSTIRTTLSMKAASPSLGGICYRVSNLQQSVNFYTSVFGMKVVEDNAKSSSVKLMMDSVGDGESAMTIELLGGFADGSELGDAYSGFGIKVANAAPVFEAATGAGGKVLLEVGDFAYAASLIPDEDEMKNTPVRYGQLSDPDGYKIEVREDRKMKEHSRKLFKLTLNVLDIEESVAFYRDVLGMTVLRRRSNVWGIPKHASMCAFMGYSDEVTGPYLELHYNYAVEKLEMGSGLAYASFLSSDLGTITDAVKKSGKTIEVLTEAEGTRVQIRDPSEYQVVVCGV